MLPLRVFTLALKTEGDGYYMRVIQDMYPDKNRFFTPREVMLRSLGDVIYDPLHWGLRRVREIRNILADALMGSRISRPELFAVRRFDSDWKGFSPLPCILRRGPFVVGFRQTWGSVESWSNKAKRLACVCSKDDGVAYHVLLYQG